MSHYRQHDPKVRCKKATVPCLTYREAVGQVNHFQRYGFRAIIEGTPGASGITKYYVRWWQKPQSKRYTVVG